MIFIDVHSSTNGMPNMKAVILAAGHGTRLWPLSESMPKVMVSIGNRPIIDYVVDSLVANSIKEIAIVVGYHKEAVMSHLGDGSDKGVKITYYLQNRPLGTAHALLCAKPFLDRTFLVVPGDNLIDERVIKDALESRSGNVLVLTQSNLSSEYGVVTMRGDRVVKIEEKPEDPVNHTISTGIFKLQPEMVTMLEEETAQGITGISSAISKNLDKMDLEGIMTTGKWWDAIYPWDILQMNSRSMDFRGQVVKGHLEEGVVLKGPVHIGKGSRIRSGCYIEGPVHIGKGCDIGPYVTLYPGTSIGNEVQIEPYTFISGSVIYDAVSIGSHCHLSRSLIGQNSNIFSNCTMDSGPVQIIYGENILEIEDLGTIIGPGSKLSAGVTIRPGVVVGSGCRLGAGITLRENLKSRTEAV